MKTLLFPRSGAGILVVAGAAFLLSVTGGCKSGVTVAGSGDEDDPQVQEHNRLVMKHVADVDKDPRLTPDQKAQVKHDLLADGIIHGGKKN